MTRYRFGLILINNIRHILLYKRKKTTLNDTFERILIVMHALTEVFTYLLAESMMKIVRYSEILIFRKIRPPSDRLVFFKFQFQKVEK